MKDKQVQSAGPQPGIPLISPVLHVISMTALVFLRTSFGYAFLSPKSIFLALTWALGLFAYYATHEPGVWPRWWALTAFWAVAAALYLAHLLAAFVREIQRSGEHDYYSGTPHLMRFAALFPRETKAKMETAIQLWIEPAVVLVGALLAGASGIPKLPSWLTFTALCLWCKEAINYWYRLRHEKKQTDIFRDAGESIDAGQGEAAQQEVSAGGRRARISRPRANSPGSEQNGSPIP